MRPRPCRAACRRPRGRPRRRGGRRGSGRRGRGRRRSGASGSGSERPRIAPGLGRPDEERAGLQRLQRGDLLEVERGGGASRRRCRAPGRRPCRRRPPPGRGGGSAGPAAAGRCAPCGAARISKARVCSASPARTAVASSHFDVHGRLAAAQVVVVHAGQVVVDEAVGVDALDRRGGAQRLAAAAPGRSRRSRWRGRRAAACRPRARHSASPRRAWSRRRGGSRRAPPRRGSRAWLRTAWNCSVSASIGVRGCRPAARAIAAVGALGDLRDPLLGRLELLLAVGAQLGAAGVERDRLLERHVAGLELRHHLLELGQRRLEAHLRRPGSRPPQPCPRSISTRTCAATDAASALRSYPPSRVETIRPAAVPIGEIAEPLGHPGEVGLDEVEVGERIAGVGVEAGRDDDQLGRVRLERRAGPGRACRRGRPRRSRRAAAAR